MSKKKSYMDESNIVSEGILDTILRSIVPKEIQDKVHKSYIKQKEKEIQDLKKQKEESDKKLDAIIKDLEKEFNKRFPKSVRDKVKNKVG